MKKLLLCSVMLVLCSINVATAQESAPITNPESAAALIRAILDTVGERVDLGGTLTVKPTEAWDNAPSVSVMGKIPGLEWSPNDRLTLAAGLTYSYVLQWEEHFAGIGGTVTLFETPAGILKAKSAIPAADVVLPRMTKVKGFASLQTRVPEPLLGLTAGLTVPF